MTEPISTIAELQAALVRKLRRDGVLHAGRVDYAFQRVPRHQFLPGVSLDLVYRDVMIPTKLQAGEHVSSSSQPAIMAIMLEQLDARPGDNVLEVGAGTGYNAALLAEIVGDNGNVTTIDLDSDTVMAARDHLAAAGYSRVRVEEMDGAAGYASCAPYDCIIATVGLADIPLAWWTQLKPSGRLVMPLEIRGVMKAVAFGKDNDGRLISTSIRPAGFMPFRGAAPLTIREERVGPELGLFAWFSPDRHRAAVADGSPDQNPADVAELPTDRHPGDVAAPAAPRVDRTAASDPADPGARGPGRTDLSDLTALLSSEWEDVPSGVSVTGAELGSGLNLWIRAHQPLVCTLHVEGALADSVPVPGLLTSRWAAFSTRDRVTLGLYAQGELALLARREAPTAPHNAFELVVRAFGGRTLANQLVQCIRAWRDHSSPTDDQLHLQLIPHGRQAHSQPIIRLAAGQLEVTWSPLPRADR